MQYLFMIMLLFSALQLLAVAIGLVNYNTKNTLDRVFVVILCFMFFLMALDILVTYSTITIAH